MKSILLLLSLFLLTTALRAQRIIRIETPPAWHRPVSEVYLGSQLPLQHVAGFSVRLRPRWAVFGQVGFSSAWYANYLLRQLEKRRPDQAQSYQYLRANLQSVAGLGFGGRWQPGHWRLSIWMQTLNYRVDGTASELVNNLAPDEAERINERVDDYRNRFPVVGNFYDETWLQPAANLSQLGLSFGRAFSVPRVNRLKLALDLGVLATVDVNSRVRSEGSGLIGRFIANQITPTVTERLRKRFDGLLVPAGSLTLSYRFQ